MFNDMTVISRYSAEAAIADGVLVEVGAVGTNRVLFTASLLHDGYTDAERRRWLIGKALQALKRHDHTDDEGGKFRCLRFEPEGEEVFVVLDGAGITLMRPEDY